VILQRRGDVQLHEPLVHSRAGAKLKAVADFFAESVEGAGGAETVAGALRIVTTRDVAAVAACCE
jgi:hypothetical protein